MDSRGSVSRVLSAGAWGSAVLLMGGLITGDARWLRLGMIVLLATPPARVAVLALSWAREKDWVFAGVSLAVLGLMSLPLLF